LKINKSTFYYKSQVSELNVTLAARIKEIASVRVRYGYPRIHVLLRREGFAVNRKRVYRLYALQGLNLRPKMPHRKRAAVPRAQRQIATRPNEIWAMDFMHERLADGSKIRLLTIVDLFSRECVALSVARSFKSPDVVRVLNHACSQRGKPNSIRCDNGTEFVAEPLDQWAFWRDVKLDFSRPGKPTDNAFCESFNGRVRAEFLNPSYFETLAQARRAAGIWRHEYNEFRPHSMLGNQTPGSYARAAIALKAS
jgi:putative transposase